ncbi:hypothetical protein C1I95_00455 [Micromonospora craterilacus]|uniref:Uncharacterized protein n=1 Tax=Micromonospora craterilacus TaxID=1655439 RepID=A0A2W2FG93_9ACTN|nr:hypothetical protein [Micromonospora craterilacus]PZG24420.1 hypothetical protein C1I95_00455 [Micromonospora craterilacus]
MRLADAILYLDDRSTGLLLGRMDPVRTVARALAGPTPEAPPACRTGDLTVVSAAPAGPVVCLVSSPDLRWLPLACVVAALARALVRRRIPLVGLLGDARCEAVYLRPLAAVLPPGSQVTICRPGPAPAAAPGGPDVTRRRGGVDVTVTRAVPEALRGADLVIVTTVPPDALDPAWPATGAALLDATGVTTAAGPAFPTWPGLSHRVTRAEVEIATNALAAEVYREAKEARVGRWLPR